MAHPRHRRGHPGHPLQRRRRRGPGAADAASSTSAEVQATYILDMPLRRLTKFSRLELEKERDELTDDDRRADHAPRRRGPAAQDRLRRARRRRQDPRHPAAHGAPRVGRAAGPASATPARGRRRARATCCCPPPGCSRAPPTPPAARRGRAGRARRRGRRRHDDRPRRGRRRHDGAGGSSGSRSLDLPALPGDGSGAVPRGRRAA